MKEGLIVPPKRVVIIANGELKKIGFYRKCWEDDDLFICANGGTKHALALGLKPEVIIGDLDSLDREDRKRLKETGSEFIEHSSEKEKSDLELALDYAVSLQPAEIIIIGALGGKRVDHAFINLLLLNVPFREGIPARIIDENHEIFLAEKETIVNGAVGDYISLFPQTGDVCGIVTAGLKYPLNDEILHFASTRGLSNEMIAPRAKITFKSGLLLVIKSSFPFRSGPC